MLVLLDFLLALLISILLVRRIRRLRPDLRPVWQVFGLSMLFCFLADGVLLAALPILRLSFGSVGLPLFMISGVRLVVFIPALLLLQQKPRRPHAIVLLAVVGLLQAALFAGEVDGLYIEPFRLGVTELSIHAPAFFPNRPLRILQISDLHVEHTTRRERDVLAQVERLQPDIIVLTGDYVNLDDVNDQSALTDAREIISRLHAPHGVYAIMGTTDTPTVMATVFDGLNVEILNDRTEVLHFPGGDLYLVGVKDRISTQDRQVLQALLTGIPAGGYTLLLYHTPDLIEAASASGVDLYLAGHTHGGQVRLPLYGALITFSEYGKKYEMGEYLIGPTTLYVSRGLGMEGYSMPRARFLCPPELVMVELGK